MRRIETLMASNDRMMDEGYELTLYGVANDNGEFIAVFLTLAQAQAYAPDAVL